MIILIAVLLVITFILIIPVCVEISLNNRDIRLKIKLLGIPIKKVVTKKSSNEEINKEKFEKDTKSFTQKIKSFTKIYRVTTKLTKKYVKLRDVKININFGTGDAAITAVSTGLLWANVCGLTSAVSHITKMDKPQIQINPNFNECYFNVSLGCILSTRIVYIIIIALALIKLKLKEEV